MTTLIPNEAYSTEPRCSGNGYCIKNKYGSYCVCNSGYTGYNCSKKASFEGCKMNPPCNGHGICSDDGKYCYCNRDWIEYMCQDPS